MSLKSVQYVVFDEADRYALFSPPPPSLPKRTLNNETPDGVHTDCSRWVSPSS